MSSLRAHTRGILESAASMSGYTIVVSSDSNLDVWSSTRYPRQGEKNCLVSYNPSCEKFLDYLIAHECGHIYRFFTARPEDRLVPATYAAGLSRAKRQVAEHWKLRPVISRDLSDQFLESLCFGLVRQLTSIPADCRIDAWVYENFEWLREIQASALHTLHATSLRCLESEIRKWTPPPIYAKSNTMNYVLAKAIGKLLDEPYLTVPYVEQGFAEIGEKLDSYLREPDRGHAGDMCIVDAWARELSLEGWYHWVRLGDM
ncbi:MAG: hypothetical protein HY645_13340 [Acidobacteria bacterium]|nr:hypothetical protein [Acidobacteriota bacterium]